MTVFEATGRRPFLPFLARDRAASPRGWTTCVLPPRFGDADDRISRDGCDLGGTGGQCLLERGRNLRVT